MNLTTLDIKNHIFYNFNVNNLHELTNSGSFKSSINGMGKLDFRYRKTWEMLYRRFIGVLPYEQNQEGYGCINGINIFDYFHPWQVFELDPKTATNLDIRGAYRRLCKIYHPDNRETGDARIFSRINQMYRSVTATI